MISQRLLSGFVVSMLTAALAVPAFAQTVGLATPRLITTMPMGGQAGTTFPVTISGQSIDGDVQLLFSGDGITAVPKKSEDGQVQANQFVVTIAADANPGVHEARVMTRLGISSSRAFSIGQLPEVVREKPNTTLETAMPLTPGTVCNAYTSGKAVDFYSFQCDQKTRVVIDCAATGIDSKLKPVLTISDSMGRDLAVDRRDGFLDFTAPTAGQYFIKVHDLTFGGGTEWFYRLALQFVPGSGAVARQPGTQRVNVISVPASLSEPASVTEHESDRSRNESQEITLPCDIAGAFFPAADVDTYQFTAKKGEIWWLEVVSERLGLPTNPFVLVQKASKDGETMNWVDVAEFNDVVSPVRVTSGAYSYDGAPYDVGTADPMGMLEIKEDGQYRLQIRDLFGGTRRDPRCVYRLIVRQAAPDFSIAAWALHMELRNGDRSVLSKPIALRNGATQLFEVVAVRKDGFTGPIQISMVDLPAGVTATGLTIPAGASYGTLLITGVEGSATASGVAKILGKAEINGAEVVRQGRVASMASPVRDQWSESPSPRLMADVAVSVTQLEAAPLTIAPASPEPITATATEKLTIPLKLTWRGEFSGALKLKPVGPGFTSVAGVEVPLNAATVNVIVDLAALKLTPGEHAFSLYGGLVTKYRYYPEAVDAANEELRLKNEEITQLTAASQAATAAIQTAAADAKAASEAAAKEAAEKLKQAEAGKAAIEAKVKSATAASAPSELVDLVVSEPIRIIVKEAAAQ